MSRTNIVHVAYTPLAGAPLRLIRALNAHTDLQIRLITVNRYKHAPTFKGDLWWHEDRVEAEDALRRADVIHLHHFMDLRHNALAIDLADLQAKGARIVRQYHSNPYFLSKVEKIPLSTILNDPLPSLVLPQFQERFYPKARLVPNIVELRGITTRPKSRGLAIHFQPSKMDSVLADRWETKGAPQVLRELKRLGAQDPSVQIFHSDQFIPPDENLHRMNRCHICIDDVVTGSFHQVSLEAMALGVPAVSYLDARQVAVLSSFTKTSWLPWINLRLSALKIGLKELSMDPSLVADLGRDARAWMERYWDPSDLVMHYYNIYSELMADRFAPRQGEQPSKAVARYLSVELADVEWAASHLVNKN